jgi:two-component system LytT family response regulator
LDLFFFQKAGSMFDKLYKHKIQPMIKAIIIDDEEDGRVGLQKALEFYCPTVKVLAAAGTIPAGIEIIRNHQPDLVFLDIMFGPDEKSFSLLEHFQPAFFELIFVTGHEEFALKAIDYFPAGYLVKPLDPDKLTETVNKAVERIERSPEVRILSQLRNQHARISISTRTQIDFLIVANIIRLESFGNTIVVHPANWEKKRELTNKTLSELESYLENFGFFRVHQSHLVNLAYIRTYLKGPGTLILADGSEVPVSRKRKDDLIKELMKE